MPALEASFAVLFIAIPGPTARAGNRRWLIESSRAGQTRERQDAIVVGVPPPQSEFDPAGVDQANFCREEPTFWSIQRGNESKDDHDCPPHARAKN
jgi:hypothetical protein